jgi:hypothetical protein
MFFPMYLLALDAMLGAPVAEDDAVRADNIATPCQAMNSDSLLHEQGYVTVDGQHPVICQIPVTILGLGYALDPLGF